MYASHFVAPSSTRKCLKAVRFSVSSFFLITRQTFQHVRNIWLHKATALYATMTRARWKKKSRETLIFPTPPKRRYRFITTSSTSRRETYKLSSRRRKVSFSPHQIGGTKKCNKGDFMRNIKKQKKKESQYLWTSPTHAREKFSFAFALFSPSSAISKKYKT